MKFSSTDLPDSFTGAFAYSCTEGRRFAAVTFDSRRGDMQSVNPIGHLIPSTFLNAPLLCMSNAIKPASEMTRDLEKGMLSMRKKWRFRRLGDPHHSSTVTEFNKYAKSNKRDVGPCIRRLRFSHSCCRVGTLLLTRSSLLRILRLNVERHLPLIYIIQYIVYSNFYSQYISYVYIYCKDSKNMPFGAPLV